MTPHSDSAGIQDRTGRTGNRHVVRPFDYTLGSNVETLMLTGAALNGTGNELNNTITGNGGDGTLVGLGGNDILMAEQVRTLCWAAWATTHIS